VFKHNTLLFLLFPLKGWVIASHFAKSVPNDAKQTEYLRSALHFFESSKSMNDPFIQNAWKCLNEIEETPAVRKEKTILEACQLMSKHLETIIPAHVRQADVAERTSILKQYCMKASQYVWIFTHLCRFYRSRSAYTFTYLTLCGCD
jgi:hypothetical protein